MKSYHKQTQESMMSIKDHGALLEIAEKGLMALSIELGLEALRQMLEQDVTDLVGPRGKHSGDRRGYRHGTERTQVVLGGQKVSLQRPRARSLEGHEFQLRTLKHFQSQDPLSHSILARLLSGVSCRKYARTLDAHLAGKATSKSTVNRRFTQAMETLMAEFFSRRLDDSYPVLMLDGVALSGMTVVTAMGITQDGHKKMLGIVEGGSENQHVVNELLRDLIDRGLDPDQERLVVIDGSKALRKAVCDTFGDKAVIQRCHVHKKRNVLSHLPDSEKANIGLALSRAYLEFEEEKALKMLNQIAATLEPRYPKAAGSIREGLEESLSVHRLKIPGLLRQTLSNTNALESANSVSMRAATRVSGFRDGAQALRWMAAGFMEAEASFRRVRGYKQIPVLTAHLSSLLAQQPVPSFSHIA